MFNSLSKKIVAYMILLTFGCAVVFTWLAYSKVQNSMVLQMKNDGVTLINVVAREVEGYSSSEVSELQKIFSSIKEKNMDSIEYISIVDSNLSMILDDTKVYGTDAVTTASKSSDESIDGVTSASNSDFIKKTINDKKISGYMFRNKEGQKVYNISAPITSSDGKTNIANIGISLKPMYNQLKDTMVEIVIITLIIQVITIILSIIISKSLTRSLSKITKGLEKIEKNDLTVEIEVGSSDEIGKLSKALNSTVDNLRNTIGTIKDTATTLNNSSSGLLLATTNSSTISEEIAASIEEVSSVIEGHNENIANIVNNFEEFSSKLDLMLKETGNIIRGNSKIQRSSQKGYDELNVLIQSINEVRILFNNSTEKIARLNDRIAQINDVTTIINNITEQTNLLSLNASIEAARVGSLGTGFGVVAEEIRNLSEQVSESSKEINNLVSSITVGTQEILDGSMSISDKMVRQINSIEQTVDACQNIRYDVNKNSEYIDIVEKSLRSINSDKNNITSSVNNISCMSQEISASTQEISATVMTQAEEARNLSDLGDKLNEVSDNLNALIEKFNI